MLPRQRRDKCRCHVEWIDNGLQARIVTDDCALHEGDVAWVTHRLVQLAELRRT